MRRFDVRAVTAGLCAFIASGASLVQRPACLEAHPKATGKLSCIDDVWSLWSLRALRFHTFPMTEPGRFGLPRGTVEYPVLTDLWAWAVALPVDSARAFLLLSSVLTALIAAAVASALAHAHGWRALLFACSPALALYAVHNWDVLPVAATAAGLLAWRRDRTSAAAAAFAVGACFKLYPALFLLPLIAELRFGGHGSRARQALVSAAVTAAVPNLPFLLLSPHLWAQVWSYQSQRPVDISATSLWSAYGGSLPLPLVNATSALVLVGALAVVMAVASARASKSGLYPGVACAAALLCSFIALGKVGSPQYMLWLMPFFVVLDVGFGWWVLAEIADAGVWFAVLRHFTGPSFGVLDGSSGQVAVAVTARAAMLLALAVRMLSLPFSKPAAALAPVALPSQRGERAVRTNASAADPA